MWWQSDSTGHVWRTGCYLIIDFGRVESLLGIPGEINCKGGLNWVLEGLSCQAWACGLYSVDKGQAGERFVEGKAGEAGGW